MRSDSQPFPAISYTTNPYRRSINEWLIVTAATFGLQARHLHSGLHRVGANLHDMRSSESLELRLGPDPGIEPGETHIAEPTSRLAWIESDHPFARPVPPTRLPSRIAYFLDGSQRTLPGYHCAAIPILASITTAGILERESPNSLRIMPEMIAVDRSWLAPLHTADPDIRKFVEFVTGAGHTVVDPLQDVEEPVYATLLRDYATMEQRALGASRKIRSGLENGLLGRWLDREDNLDAWMIVDGALRGDSRNVIGLVKSFTRQYVSGHQAGELFRLPAGYRTSAFVVDDKWRPGAYAVWYLRFWDATGRDPRHSLVRVEIADPNLTTRQVDTISSWVLSERTPRATADSRWATLLYPIHYLEQILKRYLDSETRFWPGTGASS